MSEDLSRKVLDHFDDDGNGEIDYKEFVRLVMDSNHTDSTSLNTTSDHDVQGASWDPPRGPPQPG